MRTLDKVLLEIDKPVIEEIVTSSGFKLWLDPSYRFEWNTSAAGVAKIIPPTVAINENDEVAISYHIIAARDWPNTDENYNPVTEGNPHYEKYTNRKGWWIIKAHLPKPYDHKWVGTLQNDRMELIDGLEGTQSEVERWLSQFTFGNDENFTYKNLITIGEKQYWKAPDFNIFAKRVGDEVVSVSDRIICKPIHVDLTTRYNLENGTIEPPFTYVGMFTDRGRVVSSVDNSGIEKGDIVSFEEKFCEKYTLWGVEYFLIKKDRVDAIWQNPETILQTN